MTSMDIAGLGATAPAGLRRTTPARLGGTGAAALSGTRQPGAAFQVPEETATAAAETAAPLADVAAVALGAMLAAEALDRGASRDRAARRHGQAVLAGLTALQRALLDGGAPGSGPGSAPGGHPGSGPGSVQASDEAGVRTADRAAALERLGALIAEMPQAEDQRLAALLGTIVLRARVELARLEPSGHAK